MNIEINRDVAALMFFFAIFGVWQLGVWLFGFSRFVWHLGTLPKPAPKAESDEYLQPCGAYEPDEPVPAGPFRTAGAVSDAATPETPEPEPVGFWRELVIEEWTPLLGCPLSLEVSTDNRKWTSARIYAPQRNKEAIRDTVEKFVRSVAEAQQMAATLQNGIVR